MIDRTEQVWRHLIDRSHHGVRRFDSVSALAHDLSIPVSTVHQSLEQPRKIDIMRVHGGGGIRVLDPGRLLMLWAGRRKLARDVLHRTVVGGSAGSVENALDPERFVLGGCGAVTARLPANMIADYSTVLAYGDPSGLPEFPSASDSGRTTELVFLEPDPLLRRYGATTTLGQAWVDLFNTPGWQAARFVYELIPALLTEGSDALLHA